MGGLCGAATTSLYLADRAPEGVAGVFLFEPEFYLSEQEAANADGEAPREDAEKGTWRSRLPLQSRIRRTRPAGVPSRGKLFQTNAPMWRLSRSL